MCLSLFLRAGGELSDGMDIGYVDSLAIHPPIFFSSCRKENGHSWSKEKTLRDDLTPLCQITRNGGCPSRTADQIWKSPTGCAILKSQISASLHQKVLRTQVLQIGRPLLLFPLLLPRLSLGGISKGESTKAPPGADKARCFRGNGTIGGPLGPGIVSP